MDYIPIYPVPPEGRLAIVTDAGRDAVAACGARFVAVKSTANDDGAAADGQSRVVPASRC